MQYEYKFISIETHDNVGKLADHSTRSTSFPKSKLMCIETRIETKPFSYLTDGYISNGTNPGKSVQYI